MATPHFFDVRFLDIPVRFNVLYENSHNRLHEFEWMVDSAVLVPWALQRTVCLPFMRMIYWFSVNNCLNNWQQSFRISFFRQFPCIQQRVGNWYLRCQKTKLGARALFLDDVFGLYEKLLSSFWTINPAPPRRIWFFCRYLSQISRRHA